MPHTSSLAARATPPIQGKDRAEDKLVVLDILAQDQQGRRFNVEMQTTLPAGLPRRLLYYNCLNYLRQIGEGDRYSDLRPAISICVLDRVLFRDHPRHHHSFRLRCDQTELVLTNDLEFHTLELPKFEPLGDNTASLSAEEKRLYLLQNAETMEVDRLSALLDEQPYHEALGVLEMISKNPQDLQFYEARLKFLRDEEAKLEAAMQEGMEKGMVAGKVQTLQELLGEPVFADDELLRRSVDELTTLVLELQSRLRRRDT